MLCNSSLKSTCWDCKRKLLHHKLKETPFLFLLLLLHYIAGPISAGSCESPKCKCVWKRLHMCMANGVIHDHADSCDFLLRKSVHHWLLAAMMAAQGRITVYSTHYWQCFSAPSFSVTRKWVKNEGLWIWFDRALLWPLDKTLKFTTISELFYVFKQALGSLKIVNNITFTTCLS